MSRLDIYQEFMAAAQTAVEERLRYHLESSHQRPDMNDPTSIHVSLALLSQFSEAVVEAVQDYAKHHEIAVPDDLAKQKNALAVLCVQKIRGITPTFES